MATATKTFALGAQAELIGTFTNDGTPVDPTEVTLTVKAPSGTKTIKTYGAGELVRESVGVYSFAFDCAEAGRHYYEFAGTGAYVATDETSFWVNPSQANA